MRQIGTAHLSLTPRNVRITEIRIRPTNTPRVRAHVRITIDDSFVVRGIRVIRLKNRHSVEFPRQKQRDGSYVQLVAPINADARKMIEEKILAEFEKVTGEATQRGSSQK